MKDSVASRLDEIHNKSCKGFEESGVVSIVVNEEQLKVGRVSHLTAAKLAKTEDRIPAGCTGALRPSSSRYQLGIADSRGLLQDHVAQICQRVREIRKRSVTTDDVRRVDEEHLTILEGI